MLRYLLDLLTASQSNPLIRDFNCKLQACCNFNLCILNACSMVACVLGSSSMQLVEMELKP